MRFASKTFKRRSMRKRKQRRQRTRRSKQRGGYFPDNLANHPDAVFANPLIEKGESTVGEV